VPLRLARDLLPDNAKSRGRGNLRNGCEDGELVGQTGGEIVEFGPGRVRGLPGQGVKIAEPSPALPDVLRGHEDLVIALGPPLVVDQGAVGFHERRCGENGGRALRRRRVQVIEHQHV
jgi:hypothetical protein